MMSVEKEIAKPRFLFSVRFLVTVLAFTGYCLQYMLKINMGIAIVCMVNYTALSIGSMNNLYVNKSNLNHLNDLNYTFINDSIYSHNSSSSSKCLMKESHTSHFDGPYVWTKSIQGFTLASYFYGYIITQVPGGWLSAKYGGRIVLVISNLVASVLTIICPFTARLHYIALAVCRFLIGLAHGVFWPAMSQVFVYWAPAAERTIIIGTSTAGAWVGNIIALPLGGFLCIYGFDSGWPSIFYIFGIMGLIWSILFCVLIRNSPKDHPFISDEEKNYLIEFTKNEVSAREQNKLEVPWKEIFKSKACWAIFIAHACNNWGNYLYLTQLPSFMKDVLKFDIKSNGLMSAIPYISCALSNGLLAILSQHILMKEWLNRKYLRKVFTGIGLAGPMILLICLSFVNCSMPYLGVAFLTIGLGLNAFYWASGALVNINDISGAYSGVVFGIANTFGTFPGIVSPYLTGLITKHQTQKEWQIVFVICAIVYFAGSVVFWFLSDGYIQPWAVNKQVVNSKSNDVYNEDNGNKIEPAKRNSFEFVILKNQKNDE